MIRVSKRALDWIYSIILLTIVLLSWGFVIYAANFSATEQLQETYPYLFPENI
ncbi:small integral membrane protein 27-like [Heptranchias perlo]|uniref:small integral membrane protein 27-like n=1 Tax=Heptranchias perlo TaxID=212740 RepID=UPI00355A3840